MKKSVTIALNFMVYFFIALFLVNTISISIEKEKKSMIIYDVPKLMKKNIDQIKAILGKPSGNDDEPTKLQIQNGIIEWEKSFIKNGYELLITYNAKTRKVIDFFVGTNEPSGVTKNYQDLIKICNLSSNSSQYRIEPIPTIKDKTKYTGIKIKTK